MRIHDQKGASHLVVIVFGVIGIAVLGFITVNRIVDSSTESATTVPETSNPTTTPAGQKPSGITTETEFQLGDRGNECSKPISGEWKEVPSGPMQTLAWEFYPSDMDEYDTFCRATWVIEYHAVLDVMKRDDVREVLERYDSTEAWVKALNYQYIEDTEYIDRILPDYSDVNIHCILVFHSPEGDRFFLEDGDTHHEYIEVGSSEFLASLNNAYDEDVNTFWLNLR